MFNILKSIRRCPCSMNGIAKSEKDISIFHLPKNWPPMPMHLIRWKLPSSAILNSIWEAYDFRGITLLLMEAPRMTFAQTYHGRRPAPLRAKPTMLPQALSQIEEELGIIGEVGYEEYFLLTWEILEDCKTEGIEWITAAARGGQSRLLLPRHFLMFARSGSNCISGGSQPRPHGAEQASGYRHRFRP